MKTHVLVPVLTRFVAPMAALMLTAGCVDADDIFRELVPDKEDYNFETSCAENPEFQACLTCCQGLDGESALLDEGLCGCADAVENHEVCGDTTSSETCSDCCVENDYNTAVTFRDEAGLSECTCYRTQPVVAPVEEPMPIEEAGSQGETLQP